MRPTNWRALSALSLLAALILLPASAQEQKPQQAQAESGEELDAQANALAKEAKLTDATRKPLKPQVVSVGENRYRIGEALEFDSQSRSIFLPVKLTLDGRTKADGTPAPTAELGEVPIEFYLIEANNGPVHETLLTTEAKVAELQLALLLLSYEADQRVLAKQRLNARGEPISGARNAAMDALLPEVAKAGRPESLLQLTLSWVDENGVEQSMPVREALKNKNDLRPAPELNFAFTGSYQEQNYFAAASTGTLISSFLVHEAILNPADVDALADDLLVPNAKVLPASGQEMTLTLSPVMAEKEDKAE